MAPTFVLLLFCIRLPVMALPDAVGRFELPVAVDRPVPVPTADVDLADALFLVKKLQSSGFLLKNAGIRSSLGQTPLLLHGLELQQPQKVGLVRLQDQNVFGVEHC
jgi:hypothetical protein